MNMGLPWSSLASAISNIKMDHQAAYFLQQFLNAAQLASFYMPLAAAFALIQAITRRVFLSFGDFAMFGSFAAVYVCFGRLLQGDSDIVAALTALAVAMICAGALGKAAAKNVFAPLIKGKALPFMITSLGFSIAIQELMRLTSQSRDIWIPPLFHGQNLYLVQGSYPVILTLNNFIAMVVSLTSLITLGLILRRTQFGRNWQAVSQNEKLAMLCGIQTSRVIELTFIFGSALAAVAGWTTAITYGGTSSFVGLMLGFKAMFAAVVGGFGSVRGALLGAISLATLEVLWSASFGTAYRDAGVFGIIIVILLLKPEGLGGDATHRESEA